MGRNAARRSAYLTHDQWSTVPELAGCCRSLPPAEQRVRVAGTVANPEDAEVCDAVLTALASGPRVAKGNLLMMDPGFAIPPGDAAYGRPDVQVCAFPDPPSDELWSYAHALGALLDAHQVRLGTPGEVNALTRAGGGGECDLIIFGTGSHPLIRRLLSPPTADRVPSSQCGAVPSAILVAQVPRWPLERILLVLCGESADRLAVDWTLRLACPSTAAVTILVVVPPVPVMYHGLPRMEQTLRSVLTTDSALGREMHRATRRLAEWKVDCTLRLRQGAPDHEICQEMIERDPDLIVMATKPCRWWLRQLTRDPVCSLLDWVDRPVLFVKPTTA